MRRISPLIHLPWDRPGASNREPVPNASDVTAARGTSATLRATLARPGGYASGAWLAFSLDADLVGKGITDAKGMTTCAYTVLASAGTHGLVVGFAGDDANPLWFATDTLAVQTTATIGWDMRVSAALYAGPTRLGGQIVSFSFDDTWIGMAPTGMAAGSHTVVAKSAGDDTFAPCSGWAAMTVSVAYAWLTLRTEKASGGEAGMLSARLAGIGGFVQGATLTFKVDGAGGGLGTTDASGVATCSASVSPYLGEQAISVELAGDPTRAPCSGATALTVEGLPVTL